MIWKEVWITVDGRVYPCCRGVTSVIGDDFYFGDAYKDGILASFHSDKAKAFRSRYIATKGEWGECSTCIFSRVRSIMQAVDIDPADHIENSTYRKLDLAQNVPV